MSCFRTYLGLGSSVHKEVMCLRVHLSRCLGEWVLLCFLLEGHGGGVVKEEEVTEIVTCSGTLLSVCMVLTTVNVNAVILIFSWLCYYLFYTI
jgi:hypothetical protein